MYYSSWETLLQSPGWASGCSKGRRICWNMIPGDAGRCHIIKQGLSLSCHHPGLTQVGFSEHRNPPVSPFSPCRVKPIFSRYVQVSLTLPTQHKLSVICSQLFLPRGHPPSALHHPHLQHSQLSLLWPWDPHEALCSEQISQHGTKSCGCPWPWMSPHLPHPALSPRVPL